MKQHRIPSLIIKGVVVLTLKSIILYTKALSKTNQSKLSLNTCLINFYPRWVFLCFGHEESSSLCVVLHGISLFAFPFQYSIPYNFLRSWDLAKYQDFTRLMRAYKQFLLCFFRSILSDDKHETLHHALAISLLSI